MQGKMDGRATWNELEMNVWWDEGGGETCCRGMHVGVGHVRVRMRCNAREGYGR